MSLDHVEVWCVVCKDPVPIERKIRRSVTCSKECAHIRNKQLRARTDSRKCRFCGQPCTDEEKASYRSWRKWVRQQKQTVVQ